MIFAANGRGEKFCPREFYHEKFLTVHVAMGNHTGCADHRQVALWEYRLVRKGKNKCSLWQPGNPSDQIRLKYGIVTLAKSTVYLDTLRNFSRLWCLLWRCPKATAKGTGLCEHAYIRCFCSNGWWLDQKGAMIQAELLILPLRFELRYIITANWIQH